MLSVISAAHAFQVQKPYLDFFEIYQVRERPSRMYSWKSLIISCLLVEIPWNVLGSTLLFFCWYWTVGFSSSRAAFTFLVLSVWFPLYYTTFSHAVASISPNPTIDAVLFSVLFAFVIVLYVSTLLTHVNTNTSGATSCGVLQPYSQLGWWKWMYRISPYTYFVEAIEGQGMCFLYVVE